MEDFDSDDALIEALKQAKIRPRLKLKISEIVTAERTIANGVFIFLGKFLGFTL